MTPIADVYEAALRREESGKTEPAQQKPAEIQPEKTEAKKEPEKAEPAKEAPKSALDAALEEKPADEKKDEDISLKDLPEKLSNEGRQDNWSKARKAIEARDLKINELSTQLSQAKENPEVKSKLSELQSAHDLLKAENDTLRDAITAANVELLPEFRAKYIEGRNQLVAKAADKIKAYGGNAEALKDALALPEGARRDAALEEAMGDSLSDTAKTKIHAIVAQLDDLNEAAAGERANAQQAYERLTAKQKEELAQQQQQFESRKQQTFEAVTKRLQSEVPTLRMVDPSVPGAEEWNGGIKQAMESSQKLFAPDANPEEIVAHAIKGSRYDALEKMFLESRKELAQAKQELTELSGAQPDARGGKQPAAKGKEAKLEKSAGQVYEESLAASQNTED